MKKYITLLLIILIPSMSCGSSARYTQLVRQKQRKMEELQKCMGTNKNLQIAGLSTLGLTAVGVAGNVAEAKIIKDNTKTIEKQEKTLENKEAEYKKKEAKYKEDKAKEEEYNRTHTVAIIAREDIEKIKTLGGHIGDIAIARGYQPEQLPENLRKEFGDAMVGFIQKCYALIGNEHHISNVSAGSKDDGYWRSLTGEGSLKESDVLKVLTPNEIARCKIESCSDGYKEMGNTCIPEDTNCVGQFATSEPKAIMARMENGVCKITACSEGVPSSDGQQCVIGQEVIHNKIIHNNDNHDNNDDHHDDGGTADGSKEGKPCIAEDLGKIANATAGKYNANGVCEATACTDSTFEIKAGKCKRKQGADCTAADLRKIANATAGKYNANGVCEATACTDNTFEVKAGKCKKKEQQNQCSNEQLNVLRAATGELVNDRCVPRTCKNDDLEVKKVAGGLVCACKNGTTEDPSDPLKCVWTEKRKKDNPVEWCKNYYVKGQILNDNDPMLYCCVEIVNGNATGWDGANCNCKSGKWENNRCGCPEEKPFWNDKLNKCLKYNTSVQGYFANESYTYSWHAGGFSYDKAGYTAMDGTSACLDTSDSGNYTFVIKPEIQTEGRENTGGNCFCRMLTPQKSAWVFTASKWGKDNCWKHCARECSQNASGGGINGINLRNAFFGSVAE